MAAAPTLQDGSAALAEHAALVQRLLQTLPQAGGAVAAAQLVDTHISSVLLVGDDAWKLKKPLALSFLDFSTRAARRRFCEEELRLNRRTAAPWYLAVHPLLGPADAPHIGPACAPGDPEPPGTLDWVLHMRRFDDRRLLAHLAERGELSERLVERLADRLVDFHAALPPADARRPDAPGRPEVTLRWVRDNLTSLARLAPQVSPDGPAAGRIAALASWTDTRAAALLPRMTQRWWDGRVRECHGDAHLANWVVIGEEAEAEPVAFDALEFNAELRWIDVVAELAFPWMDLQAHGQPALANRLLNRWLERCGDFDALALLTWHAVYRALVRVKVAWIHAGEADVSEPTRAAERDAAEQGLALAERLSGGHPPRLVVTWGLSGAGKSHVARQVAAGLGAVQLRSDVERKRLYGLQPTDRPGDGPGQIPAATLYGPEATARTYTHLETIAARLLADGWSVVVDAACLRRHERRALMALAQRAGVPGHLLECRAPDAVLRQRLVRREREGRDASDAGVAVLDFQLGIREPPSPAELAGLSGCHADVIDTDTGLDTLHAALAQRCRDWLRATAVDPTK